MVEDDVNQTVSMVARITPPSSIPTTRPFSSGPDVKESIVPFFGLKEMVTQDMICGKYLRGPTPSLVLVVQSRHYFRTAKDSCSYRIPNLLTTRSLEETSL